MFCLKHQRRFWEFRWIHTDADELTNDPVLTAVPNKDALVSKFTLLRFWNRMDEDTLIQFDKIDTRMREIVYFIDHPEHMLFDLDSTLLNTYGRQESERFNYNYRLIMSWNTVNSSIRREVGTTQEE